MKKIIVLTIILYQKTLSFFLNRNIYLNDRSCRFSPTCSQYMKEAVIKYGIIKGVWLGSCRFLKCHPFSKGGFDPVT